MINVLPERSQKYVWRLYRVRFVLAISAILFIVALFASLLLLPGYLALQTDMNTSGGAPPATGTSQDAASSIVHTQSLLSTLGPLLSGTTTPSEGLRAALALRPHGVAVDQVTYMHGSFVLGGTSGRDGVNAYKNALLADPHFTAVSVPVGDLAGTVGGRFSITVSGHF